MSFSLFPTARSDPALAPFRPGLIFAFFNAMAWQIGIGTPMVLFAEQLGATPFQVGLAYAFVFVLTPIQVVSTALLPRYGFKAVMLSGWGIRSCFLAVPPVLAGLALWRGESAWMIQALVGSVFCFCVFRSIGAAASTAWFLAIIPQRVRGRYFSSDQFLSAIAGVGTLLGSAALFAWLPIYPALLIQYLVALIGSTISYFALRRLPDAARPGAISLRSVLRDTPRLLFRPSVFRRYVWLAVVFAVISTPIPPFAAYYLKVGPGFSQGQIMLFEVLRYGGVMVAAWVIRRRIDEAGAKPFFLLAVGLFIAAGVLWWLYLQAGVGGTASVAVAYFALGLGVAAWTIANLHYLANLLAEEERPLAISIQGAVTAFCGGVAPIVWGLFLKSGEGGARAIDVGVLQWFFASVVGGGVVLWWLIARLPEAKGLPIDPISLGNAILRPIRAAVYVANLIDPRSVPPKRGDGAERG